MHENMFSQIDFGPLLKYLQEDDNTFFPIENIISIKWNKDATMNVAKKDLSLAYYYG